MAKVPDIQEPIHRLPEQQRPDCPLIGQDGNIFYLPGIAARTLKQAGSGSRPRR